MRANTDKKKRRKTLLTPLALLWPKYEFTYKGKDEKLKHLDRIEVNPTITFKAPTEATEGLLFKIKSGNLESKALDPHQEKSVILYNSALGMIEKATISLKLEGELLVAIGGTDTKVTLSQLQTTTVEQQSTPFGPGQGSPTPAKK